MIWTRRKKRDAAQAEAEAALKESVDHLHRVVARGPEVRRREHPARVQGEFYMIWRELAASAAFLSWLVFLATYSLRAKWWRSPEGRNVWGVAAALTWALGIIVAAYLWPDYDIRDWLVPVTYVALAALGVQRTVQMLRRQRQQHRDRQHH
jgi:hypothetical protein